MNIGWQSFNKLTPVVVILLCNYSIYPDDYAVRVLRLTPYKTSEAESLIPLPHPEKSQRSLRGFLCAFDPWVCPQEQQSKTKI